MDRIDIVKAYFKALDSTDMDAAGQFLSEEYRLLDFVTEAMDKEAMLDLVRRLKTALPNLTHSLSNFQAERNMVKVTVQRSGTNLGHLDLRTLGIDVIARTQKFIIFPNTTSEFTVENGKILSERDVSPVSPNRRLPGLLKAFGA
jgi:predicted ester cyclase